MSEPTPFPPNYVTNEERIAMAARHLPDANRPAWCACCGQPWSCDAARLLRWLDQLDAELAEIKRTLAGMGEMARFLVFGRFGLPDTKGDDDGRSDR